MNCPGCPVLDCTVTTEEGRALCSIGIKPLNHGGPMTPPQYERRRAEDVFRELETVVFPRIEKIEKKTNSLEQGMQEIKLKGCAHREGDLLRTQTVEQSTTRIFDRIEDFGKELAIHQVNVEKRINGVRIWVLCGCVFILFALLSFFAADYAQDIDRGLNKRVGVGSSK